MPRFSTVCYVLFMTVILWAATNLELYAQGFVYPLSAAVAENGDVFVADRNLPGVWKLQDNVLKPLFEASKKFRTPLNAVRCVEIDKLGNLLAGDSATREVYRFDKTGQPVPLTNGGIGVPMDIAVNKNGDLYVADLELHRIWKVPQAGGTPIEFLEIRAPRGLFVDLDDRLWILSHGDNQVLRATSAGEIETVVMGRPFAFPHCIVVDAEGVAYVTDGYDKTVWKITPGKEPEPLVRGEPLQNPVGLAWKGESLIVVDPRAKSLFEVRLDGKIAPIQAEPASK